MAKHVSDVEDANKETRDKENWQTIGKDAETGGRDGRIQAEEQHHNGGAERCC